MNKISTQEVIEALTEVFTKEQWEIPDDAIVGAYKNKIDQLQARVDDLTRQMVELAKELDRLKGDPVKSERLDALQAAKKKSSK